jgi:CBS domain containing-hemolysin-like protein
MKAIRSSKTVDLSSILRPAYYVPISKRVNDLLREFQRQHIQLAIVINEFGGTEGIVTMEDIIEELVGEIQDEYDDEKPIVEKKSETEYLVNASASIIDVNDFLPIRIPESSDYETVSGYLNKIYEGIPSLNEKIQKDGYEYTILKRTKNTVELVRFRVLSESDNGFVGE